VHGKKEDEEVNSEKSQVEEISEASGRKK